MVMIFPVWKLIYGYSPLWERVGCMLFPAGGEVGAWLLHAGGVVWLHDYSLLGERVGCMITPR